MTALDRARLACRDLGGAAVDLWSLPPRVVERAERTGRPVPEAARDVVSGWLVTRDREGDPDARSRLVGLWHADVLRWCRWSAARGVDPEDAAQEALARAIARLHTLPDPEAFRPWLWGIHWRVLRESERRAWVRRLLPWGDEPADERRGAEEGLLAEERGALVQQVLQALPLEERTVLWLAYVDECTRPQIAAVTGWPEGTVNRRLTQARTRFSRLATRLGLAPILAAREAT